MINITWHGQSCFEIEHNGTKLIIDPFLSGNPLAKKSPDDVEADYILLTHGHNDHVGDTLPIAKRTGATVIATHELATYFGWQGVNTHGMNIGGSYTFDFGRVKLTQAFHGSSYEPEGKEEFIYLGMPTGILLTLGDKTLYHAGDTGLFGDMRIIGERENVELAMLPIGDNFTMGPDDAVVAAEWVRAKRVIPMHYNTFPVIEQDAHAFAEKLKEKGIQGHVLESGETLTL